MVDFERLLKQSQEKDDRFGKDVPVKDEAKFKELHKKICSGLFKETHDFRSHKDFSCTDCPATYQKGVPGMKDCCGEDMTKHFNGTLPEKLLQQQGLLESLHR
jgi:hypothetical protein